MEWKITSKLLSILLWKYDYGRGLHHLKLPAITCSNAKREHSRQVSRFYIGKNRQQRGLWENKLYQITSKESKILQNIKILYCVITDKTSVEKKIILGTWWLYNVQRYTWLSKLIKYATRRGFQCLAVYYFLYQHTFKVLEAFQRVHAWTHIKNCFLTSILPPFHLFRPLKIKKNTFSIFADICILNYA